MEQKYSLTDPVSPGYLGTKSGDGKCSEYRQTGWRWCQSNANQSPLFADEQVQGDEKVAPLAKSGVPFLFEPYSGVDVPFEVEVIVH